MLNLHSILGSIGHYDSCETLGEATANQDDFERIDGPNSRAVG